MKACVNEGVAKCNISGELQCDLVSEKGLALDYWGGVWFQHHAASYSTPKQGLIRQGLCFLLNNLQKSTTSD